MGVAEMYAVLPYSILAVSLLCVTASSAFNLTLLHTNDVHGRVEQTNRFSGACSKESQREGKCFGGFARIKTKVDEIRAQSPNVLFLDGGDQSQGTLWFFFFPNTTIPLMTQVGYDVMTLGNHEFDNEVPNLVEFLKMATFPIVSCNVDARRAPDLAAKVVPSTVFTKGGERIGVVGYTTVDTTTISKPEPVTFNPVVPAVQAAVDDLKAQGINKIIALGHAGITVDRSIAEKVDGVDVVIGGHSNTFLYTGTPPSNEDPEGAYPLVFRKSDQSPVLVVQDYAYGKYLGHLEVEFDDQGRVVSWSGNPILLDNDTRQDTSILDYMQPYRQQIETEKMTVIGKSRTLIQGGHPVCRKEECNMGNMLADAMVRDNLRRADSSDLSHAAIALVNAGSIRSSMDKGDITMEDVLLVQPFRNTIDVVEITGETIHKALEYSAEHRVETGDLFGGFLQVSGMKIVYDMRKPVNQRVVDVKVICTECTIPEYRALNRTHVYKVLMSTFLASGGDGYAVIKDNIIKSHLNGDLDSTILRNYIMEYSPLYPKLEGRIRFLTDDDDVKSCPDSASIMTSSFLLFLVVMTMSKLLL